MTELPSEMRARFDRRLHDLDDLSHGPLGVRRVHLYAHWRVLDYTHDEAMARIAQWEAIIASEQGK